MIELQPLEKFAETYGNPTWRPSLEHVLYYDERSRFRLIIEHATHTKVSDDFAGIWRNEELGKQGISACCEDAKEFAQKLISTMFYQLSPHQMQHVVNALQADLDKWQAERMAEFEKNPSLFGNIPPSPISCKD